MTAPNAGEVSVDVVPDTSGFEAALKAALSRLRPVNVKVEPDTSGFQASLRAALARLRPVKVKVEPDVAGFRSAIRSAVRGFTVDIKVDVDTRAAAASLAAFKTAVDSLDNTTLNVDIDTGAAAASLAALRAAIATTTTDIEIKVTVTGDTAALAAIARVAAAAAALGNQNPTPNINPPGGPGGGGGGRGFSDGSAYGRAFGAGVHAAARSIRPIQIGTNTPLIDRDIELVRRRLAQLSSQRIGIDITADAARQDIDGLRTQLRILAQSHTDVNVRADTRQALLELARMQQRLDRLGYERRVNVDSNSLGLATGRAQTLVAVIASIAPIGVPAIAAATAAIVALGAAAAVAGAAVGTALLGFSGIGGALTALRAPKTGGGGGGVDQAAQLARRRADALLAVQAAQRGLETAELDAAEAAIRSARRIEQADRAIIEAQRDLNDARREAIRTLQDLALANRRAVIDTEEAEIALRKAQEALAQVNFDESKTADERREAALAVDRARLAIDEQALANGRLKEETDAATKAGVDGAREVLDAQQALAEAEQERADVAREVAREQRDTAISLLEANLALEKSQRDYIDALNDTGTSGAGGIDKVAEAFKKLSPAGREFVLFLNNEVMPAIDRLKFTAQESMLPGVQAAIRSLMPLFGTVNTLVAAMGKALGVAAQQIANRFSSPAGLALLNYLITEGPEILGYIVDIGTALGEIGSILIVAFGSTTDQIFAGLASNLREFATWLAKAVNTPEFLEFLAYIKETGPEVMRLLADFVVVTIKLGIALAPLGGVLLKTLVWLFDWLAGLDPNTVLFIFAVAAAAIFALTGSVGALVVAVVLAVGLLIKYWTMYYEFLWDAYDNYIAPALQAIGRFFTQTIPGWLSSLGTWWNNTWSSISNGTVNAANNIWAGVSNAFRGMYTSATSWTSNVLTYVSGSFNNLVAWIGQLPGRISASVSGMFNGIPNAIRNALNQAISYWNTFASRMSIGNFGLPRINFFADGGIVPGYTPGRDTAIIGVGGGEAVMRPEWTRAVGSEYLNAANAAARAGGVAGVQKFLDAFGAPRGFATGGIVPSNLGIAQPMLTRRDTSPAIGQGQPLIGSIVLNGAQSRTRSDARMVGDEIGYMVRTGVVR